MNKRALFFIVLGVSLLALSGSQLALGKAHVPMGSLNVCHAPPGGNGSSLIISVGQLTFYLAQDDCRLPACDFNNTFPQGTRCPTQDLDGDGFCDLPNPRDDAIGETAQCTQALF